MNIYRESFIKKWYIKLFVIVYFLVWRFDCLVIIFNIIVRVIGSDY